MIVVVVASFFGLSTQITRGAFGRSGEQLLQQPNSLKFWHYELCKSDSSSPSRLYRFGNSCSKGNLPKAKICHKMRKLSFLITHFVFW